ncbi:MAG: cell envelope integrity protein TolA [Gammaproteobacteria bacterium]|nr:cell envelope integrity protein TolA [Gammaproteobacteria bacterium]
MISSELLNDIKAKPIVLVVAIVLHFVLVILLGVNLSSSEIHRPASSDRKTVKAVVVDAVKIEAEAKKLKQIEDDKKKKKLAQQKKIKRDQENAKKKLAEEKKRLADIKKKQADEKKRLADLKKKNLAEKKRIEAEKKKAEADRKKAEAEKKKIEAEKRREEEALAAKRKLEEENRRKEEAAELQRKLAEEERRAEEARQAKEKNAKLQSLRSQYVRLIEQKVERNWLRPATSTSSMSCEIIVTQTSLGDVVDVVLKKCANDLAFQRSIERAVRKASPLPPPPDPGVFDREIHFTFKPRS